MADPRRAWRSLGGRRRTAAWLVVVPLLTGAPLAAAETGGARSAGLVRSWSDVSSGLKPTASEADRLRSIARLGAWQSARAREILVDALGDSLARPPQAANAAGNSAADSGRVRLAFARALAEHAEHDDARRALARLLPIAAESASGMDDLAAGVAANALARAGTPDALEVLSRSLRQAGPILEVARAALLAHPPEHLTQLLEGGPPHRALLELFGELGDQRAFLPLRDVVREGPPGLRAPAAWALFQLGALETVALARHWWQTSEREEERIASLRILSEANEPEARRAVSQVLASEEVSGAGSTALVEAALQASVRAPVPGSEPALVAIARADDERRSGLALDALARLDTRDASRFFVSALGGPLAPRAARALALTRSDAGERALTESLTSDKARPWALRALAVRAARQGSTSARGVLERALPTFVKAPSALDRAAAAWARAVVDPEHAHALLASRDTATVTAAARQAFGGSLARAAASRLVRLSEASAPRALAELLSPSLLDSDARQSFTTERLLELEAKGTAAGPTFAVALAGRAEGAPLLPTTPSPIGQLVRGWLGAVEPELRAAAARGLASSRDPGVVGPLCDLLLWDPEATVRRAAAASLRERPEPKAVRALAAARELDPDPAVRALAIFGVAPPAPFGPLESSLVWLHDVQGALRLTSIRGESVLVHPDPDGFVGLVNFGRGPLAVAKLPPARDPSKKSDTP